MPYGSFLETNILLTSTSTFMRHYFRHAKFGDWLVFREIFFGLEGVIGKCVGCFLVYLFFEGIQDIPFCETTFKFYCTILGSGKVAVNDKITVKNTFFSLISLEKIQQIKFDLIISNNRKY